MPEILQLGPFLIKSSWLILLISGFIGFEMMKRRAKKDGINPSPILDLITSGIVIMALSWKFGPILFNPSLLLTSPWTALFLPGTTDHLWLGAVLVVGYLFWKMRHQEISYKLLLDILPFGLLSLMLLYHLLIPQYGTSTNLPWAISIKDPDFTYHPINLYLALLEIPFLVWLWKKRIPLGYGVYWGIFLLIYGMANIVVSFFEDQTVFIGGLSKVQWVFMIMVVIGIVMQPKDKHLDTEMVKVKNGEC